LPLEGSRRLHYDLIKALRPNLCAFNLLLITYSLYQNTISLIPNFLNLIYRRIAQRLNVNVVKILVSIPYCPPLKMLFPLVERLKMEVECSSIPDRLRPQTFNNIKFQNECNPQATYMFPWLMIYNEKMMDIKNRLITPVIQ